MFDPNDEGFSSTDPVQVSQKFQPIAGIERPRQILRASWSAISVCRGTASTAPVAGLHHKECDPPSRFKWQPCLRKCRRRDLLFTRC
jgi:hypothetical protein